MFFKFFPEVSKRAEHRIWKCLSQAAQGTRLDRPAKFFESVDVPGGPIAFGDFREHSEQVLGAHPARCAFSARFIVGKFEEVPGDIHHARVLVHDDHTAGTHDGPGFGKFFEINRKLDKLLRETPARRAAGLDRLEFLAVRNAAADVVYDILQGNAHRHFDEAGPVDFSSQGEGLGPPTLFCAVPGEPFRSSVQNLGHVGQGFHVVDIGRLSMQAGGRRERRSRPGHAPAAFD
ncbi:hypothetical protein ES703_92723 [subsurface metagenome]